MQEGEGETFYPEKTATGSACLLVSDEILNYILFSQLISYLSFIILFIKNSYLFSFPYRSVSNFNYTEKRKLRNLLTHNVNISL